MKGRPPPPTGATPGLSHAWPARGGDYAGSGAGRNGLDVWARPAGNGGHAWGGRVARRARWAAGTRGDMFLTRNANFPRGETDAAERGPTVAPMVPADHARAGRRRPGRAADKPGWRARLYAALAADVSRPTHDTVLRYGASVLSVIV